MTTLVTPPEMTPMQDTRLRTAKPRRGLGRYRREWPSVLIIVILVCLVVLPMAFIAVAAFSTSVPRPGNAGVGSFTLENFRILATPEGLAGLKNSLVIGFGSAIVALIVGALLAFICARTDAPWRRFIYVAGMAPMFLPALVGALAWSLLASPSAGFLNVILNGLGLDLTINIYSMGGLIFVLGMFYAPYTFMLLHSSFSMMNADLEEAATVHGSPLRTMFRTITMPLALPSMLGAGILVFALAMENFPVAAVLGNPAGIETIPTYIYRLMSTAPAQANQAAGIAIALTAALVMVTVIQQRIINRRKFTTLTGKGNRPRPVPLRKLRWPATIFALAYFMLSVLLPLIALVLMATQSSPYVNSISQMFSGLSLDRLGEALAASDFRQALTNSVMVAILAALSGTVLSFSVSYVRYRTKSVLGGLLEQIATAPLAIPSVVLGMGILWTWLSLPIPVYGTVVLLAIACVSVTLPQAYRSVSSSMLQLDSDLEDSAVMLGAGRLRAIRNVTVPLMRAGIISTVLMVLMLAMREMSASLFLYTSDTRILSILVFESFQNGGTSYAAALSVIFIFVIAALAIATQYIGTKQSAGNKNGH